MLGAVLPSSRSSSKTIMTGAGGIDGVGKEDEDDEKSDAPIFTLGGDTLSQESSSPIVSFLLSMLAFETIVDASPSSSTAAVVVVVVSLLPSCGGGSGCKSGGKIDLADDQSKIQLVVSHRQCEAFCDDWFLLCTQTQAHDSTESIGFNTEFSVR